MLRLYKLLLRSVLLFACVTAANADWINLTGAETSPNIAEIYVLDDRVRINMEIYVGDLKTFHELIPNSLLTDPPAARPDLEQRLREFSKDKIRVSADGEDLQASLILVEPRLRKDRNSPFAGMVNPYTRQRVPEAPADKRVLYVELEYPFRHPPRQLTITPPLDEGGRPTASIGFIAYHKSVPIIDFRYLGAPATVNLDWDDPWYSSFDNPNLKRHHKSALMSFLYVEPFEVRHEVLVRVKDLENWMDLGLRGDRYIEIDELDGLRQRVGEFMMSRNTVRIDGDKAAPILDRTNYVSVSVTGIKLLEKPERLEISTAIVGVILAYLTSGLPQEATVDWDLFTEQIQRVPATSIDPAGPLLTFVEPSDSVHKWTNFLKDYTDPTVSSLIADDSFTSFSVPVVSLACFAGLLIALILLFRAGNRSVYWVLAGLFLVGSAVALPYAHVSFARPGFSSPALTEEEASTVLHTLLTNIYRASEFRDEDHVYDKLSNSVVGELLADVYLQNRKSMQIQRAGGAQARVKEVEVMQMAVQPNPERPFSFHLEVTWSALGTVGHWGHVHTRKNVYEALVTLDVIEGAWKISGLEVLEEKRVDPYSAPDPAAQ